MAVRKGNNLCMTVDECAEALGMSVSTIRRKIQSGDIPVTQFSKGSAIRIPREFVNNLVSSSVIDNSHPQPTPKLPGPTPRFLKEVAKGKTA
jgi:excisionase family DNA binding protein